MGNSFPNAAGRVVVDSLIGTIHENREYLSDLDGKIGDGDHGVNMDKGIQLVAGRLDDGMGMSEALTLPGRTLLMGIGGSMGPLYGRYYKAMARVSNDEELITAAVVAEMLEAAETAIVDLGEARPGDIWILAPQVVT